MINNKREREFFLPPPMLNGDTIEKRWLLNKKIKQGRCWWRTGRRFIGIGRDSFME